MNYTERDLALQLLLQPLSGVSYYLQLFVIGAVLALVLRRVPSAVRLSVLILGFSGWFALIWLLNAQRCGDGWSFVMTALFGVPAAVSARGVLSGTTLAKPWLMGGVLVLAHMVHTLLTDPFGPVACR